MNEKIYYSAEDIAKMLGVSMGKAYKILREMNKDLASKGFLTIAGKIPEEYGWKLLLPCQKIWGVTNIWNFMQFQGKTGAYGTGQRCRNF